MTLVGILVAYLWLDTTKVVVDKITGCPVDGPHSITAVVLDVTDSLGVIQQADLHAFMDDVRDNVPQYGRLDLYTVGKIDSRPLDMHFEVCNPGNARDVSNDFSGNKALADRTWKRRFSDKLSEALSNIEKEKPEDRSPLMESIQSVSITSFEGEHSEKAEKRMIFVSDLLQYTRQLSFYSGIPDFSDIKKTQYYHQIRTELRDVNVTIAMIPRETKANVQDKKLLNFWTSYFADQGATVDHWRPIKGGQP
jgi:hypothetical protein